MFLFDFGKLDADDCGCDDGEELVELGTPDNEGTRRVIFIYYSK